MEAKHTPGDWEVFNNQIRVKRQSFNPSYPHTVIATLKARGVETRGNGLILASAPDLLAALEVIVTYFPPEHMAMKQAREAIAKAKARGE